MLKKVFIALLFPVVLAGYSVAQNTFPATGNVGVGTTAPTQKLDVVGGNIRTTGNMIVDGGDLLLNRTNVNFGAITRPNIAGQKNIQLTSYGAPLETILFNSIQSFFTGEVNLPSGGYLKSPGRVHIAGEEFLFLLNKGGTIISKAAGGNGNLQVDGNLMIGNDLVLNTRTNVNYGAIVRPNVPGQRNILVTAYDSPLETMTINATQSFFSGEVNFPASGTLKSPGRLHISGEELLYLLNKGGVIISKSWGGNGNLTAEGTLLAARVKVAVPGSANWNFAANNPNNNNWQWADYVFDERYRLKPLEEVETFIKQNKHLPNIPTTEQVKKDGIDLGQMNAKLLEKIEELTLYMIQLKKDQEKQYQKQQNEIEQLKQELNKQVKTQNKQ